MQDIVALQRWLYEGMANGLRDVASGSWLALAAAMAAAVLFGVLHAMMPGHGKTVLFSYHLGQRDSLLSSIANGAILALTHVGIAVLLVLAGFAVISRVFAIGGRTPQFELASGILVVVIGGYLLWRAVRRAAPHAADGEETAHKGRTLAFVTGLVPCPLTTFIMSYALARGLLAAGLAVTAAMAAGMVLTIAGTAILATLSRERLLSFFSRTEGARRGLARALEVGGASLVLLFGIWLIVGSKVA
jgi:ABC-type nickel/cobalt efflux system permease component RcnA